MILLAQVKQTSRGFKQQSWNNSEETQFSNNMNFVTSGGSGKHSNGSPGSTGKPCAYSISLVSP